MYNHLASMTTVSLPEKKIFLLVVAGEYIKVFLKIFSEILTDQKALIISNHIWDAEWSFTEKQPIEDLRFNLSKYALSLNASLSSDPSSIADP